MVELNKQQNEIKITMSGDVTTLVNTQTALICLMKNFNFSNGDTEGPFYWALNLLEELLPEEEQMERALSDGKYIRIPKNMTETQISKIREALTLIESESGSNTSNQIFHSLKKVG